MLDVNAAVSFNIGADDMTMMPTVNQSLVSLQMQLPDSAVGSV
jgi:hypothetical protein